MSSVWDLELEDPNRSIVVCEVGRDLHVEVDTKSAVVWFDLSEDDARKLSDWLRWWTCDAGEPQ